jgi:hypothetical protein
LRDEFNIILADLHCPLCDPPCCFFALKDTHQRPIGYDPNNMDQEVVLELPGPHKDYVEQFLNLRAPCFCILQDLADKVYGLLFDFHCGFRPFYDDNNDDNYVSGYNI